MSQDRQSPLPLPFRKRLVEMVALSLAVGLTFLIINFIHFLNFPVRVILFSCIIDLLLTTVLIVGSYWVFWRKHSTLLHTEKALVVIASCLLILLYSVMGPTVVDRSLSIYIVEKINYRGGEVAADAMKDIILKEFMGEYMVADVRMTEQLTSGTVVETDGCYRLTPRGKRLAEFTRFYRYNFLPKKRVIDGNVTDVLTDPLSSKPVLVPYECK